MREPSTAKLDPNSNKGSYIKITQPNIQSHVVSINQKAKSPPVETQTNYSAPQYTDVNTPMQPKNITSINSKMMMETSPFKLRE